MPVAAFGGRADLMQKMAPIGPVYQAGTLSGNPVAVAAGMTTLKLIQEDGFYEKLSAQADKLVKGLSEAAREAGIAFCGDAVGGMFGMYFSENVPSSYGQMMADEGVYFAPAMFEAGFVSIQHDDAVIAETVEAARRVFKRIG
jgi:glutamate-1-semialdehyde 2,1-aminomutase